MRAKYLKTADYSICHYTGIGTLVCVTKVITDYGVRSGRAFDTYTLNPLVTGIYRFI